MIQDCRIPTCSPPWLALPHILNTPLINVHIDLECGLVIIKMCASMCSTKNYILNDHSLTLKGKRHVCSCHVVSFTLLHDFSYLLIHPAIHPVLPSLVLPRSVMKLLKVASNIEVQHSAKTPLTSIRQGETCLSVCAHSTAVYWLICCVCCHVCDRPSVMTGCPYCGGCCQVAFRERKTVCTCVCVCVSVCV